MGKAVIFDLDGTLLDTLDDLAETTNIVLEQHGFAPHSRDQYRFLVGDGVRVLFQRALPDQSWNDEVDGPNLLDRCVDSFNREYATRWMNSSKPYAGIPELLDALVDQQVPIGVLSNKPQPFTELCVAQLLSRWRFAPVFGQREGIPKKPDPTSACEIIAIWGLSADQCLYLGDTNTDMQTGIAAGCVTIGATWGFRPREELVSAGAQHIIDHPSELLRLVE